MTSVIRWGIISCGKISNDFVTAVRSLPPDENQQVVAVAARSEKDAKEFAEKHKVPKAYGSYGALIADQDIDVFYIGVINTHHFELVSQLLTAGRPVLCEKPLCMTACQTRELISLAQDKQTFLMEAAWSRCTPVYRRLVQELEQGTIGNVVHISANFGIVASPDSRVRKMALGGGTALDLGIYLAQLTNLVMKNERWDQLRALGSVNEEGCDTSLSVTVTYPGGRMATLVTHCDVRLPNHAYICGTKGMIKIEPPFHAPTQLVTASGPVTCPLPDSAPDAQYVSENSALLQHQARHVGDCLRKGLKESPLMTWEDTLRTAEMVEAMRKQVGVTYPEDTFQSTLHMHTDRCI